MKRFFTLILLVVCFSTLANAQFEELKVVGHYWLPTFELEGKEIKKKEVKAFLKRTCPSALSVFQKSRNKEITAYALATVGVSAICWNIDDVFEGNLRPSTNLGLALSTGAILLILVVGEDIIRRYILMRMNAEQSRLFQSMWVLHHQIMWVFM
ncbi:MAG TPA: hypothetical protein PKD51_06555 [Saprospiraceae bacterium]|nr:hypothetical protein [Saprospiraceae bacterium]